MPRWRSSASTSAGRSPTRCLLAEGRLHTAKVPTAPRQEESVVEAARSCSSGRRPRSSGSRTARRSPRTRCSSARAPARRSSPREASSTCCTCGGRPARTSTGSTSTTRAARPARALRRRGRADRPGRRRHAPRPRRACRSVDAEAIAVCLLFSFRDASHERRGRCGAAAPVSRRARRRVARGGARVPRVRAGVDHRRRRVSRALSPPRYLRALASAARRGRPAGAARDAVVRRRRDARGGRGASGADPRLGPGRRRRRRRARRRARAASRTRSPSTWAARRPTSA